MNGSSEWGTGEVLTKKDSKKPAKHVDGEANPHRKLVPEHKSVKSVDCDRTGEERSSRIPNQSENPYNASLVPNSSGVSGPSIP